jgi:hypothetical protein
MPRDCPMCGLVNPDTSRLCDCGYDFYGGSEALRQVNVAGRGGMVIGVLLIAFGVVLCMVAFASELVFIGRIGLLALIIPGVILFGRGWSRYWRSRHY